MGMYVCVCVCTCAGGQRSEVGSVRSLPAMQAERQARATVRRGCHTPRWTLGLWTLYHCSGEDQEIRQLVLSSKGFTRF